MASFFKKKVGGVSGSSAIQVTDSEATLAQSDFNTDKILEIQSKFTRGASLLYPGRIFIREGLLWKVCRKGLKRRQFFLFNDILVYGSVVANRYSNQHILPLSQMSVTAECFYQPRADTDFDEEFEQLELDVSNAFQICHADKSFHVFALSSADKTNWLTNLHKHISRVALSLPDDQQLLTKPVWVPDSSCKDCMVCNVKFTAFIRKHHCRQCGRVICSSCSPYRVALDGSVTMSADTKKMERICKDCFKDRSSQNVRRASGGKPPSRPPPPNAAAKTVIQVVKAVPMSQAGSSSANADSAKLESATEPSLTGHHDSSTDTEDSDDSDEENVAGDEAAVVATLPPVSPTETVDRSEGNEHIETDSQPTPPPRKKRLKKKLEEVLMKEIENVTINDVKVQHQGGCRESKDINGSQEDLDTEKEQLPSTTEQQMPETAMEEKVLNESSPKKIRRRMKHAGHADQPIQAEFGSTSEGVVVADSDNTQLSKLSADDSLPNEPHSSTSTQASSSNETNAEQSVSSESHDQVELHTPGSHDGIELSGTGAEDRKKRGRRNKFK